VLELLGVSRRFGGLTALADVTLALPAGVTGLLGANGAGKTTLMRVVLGLVEPDRGTVRLHGAPVDATVRQRFGYLPEERGLYPRMRVRDQLVHLARLHGVDAPGARRRADAWLERLGLGDRGRERLDALSLGNQQRVQLAAALVHDPEVLVLDEPFSGLDPPGVELLTAVLAEHSRAGSVVLLSSHQLDLLERLCDRAAVLDAGRLVLAGPVDELRRRPGGQRWRVAVRDARDDWTAGLPARVVAREPAPREITAREITARGPAAREPAARAAPRTGGVQTVVVELDPGGEDALLDAARAGGTVVHLSRVEPTLADLYRAVTGP